MKGKQVYPLLPLHWCRSGILLICIAGLTGCLRFENQYTAIPPGPWRATLELSANPEDLADEHSGGLLPVNLDVYYVTPDSFCIDILNGKERITCCDIQFGRDPATGRDTIRIALPVFGTYITGRYEEDAIEGDWWDPNRGDQYHIPFRAYHGRKYRFKVDAEAGYKDFAGRWKAVFEVETDHPYPAIVEIEQQDHDATGTILTETGDYRYLQGNVEDDRLYLSTFDGSHAYLFEAKMLDDGSLAGTYRSGNHYKTYWSAVRNDTAELRNPYGLTKLKPGYDKVAFTLPNTEGKMVSLSDAQYEGKPKIISLFGTWCPNCRDEQEFLSQYFADYQNQPVKVIAIAFERMQDSVRAVQAVRRYKHYYHIPWEMLYGGSSKHESVHRDLPMLEGMISYPMLLFLDRDNHVVKIHTGFYGPATERYPKFKQEFDQIVTELAADG